MTAEALSCSMLSGLADIADRYQAMIVDLWGVLHDGERAYPGALDALRRLRAHNVLICLLSNSPRRAAEAGAMLAAMGIGRGEYDDLVTSGEATFDALRAPPDAWHAALGRRYLPVGPSAKNGLLAGLDRVTVPTPDQADFVLNTGTDGRSDIEEYKPLLTGCIARHLPMICANPDLSVMVGSRTVACAGALAQYYEALGGDVRYHGKPHGPIYSRCLERLRLPGSAVLAVGDALRTDIAGANVLGIDSAFVTSGIHREELGAAWGIAPSADRLASLLDCSPHRPTFLMARFSW